MANGPRTGWNAIAPIRACLVIAGMAAACAGEPQGPQGTADEAGADASSDRRTNPGPESGHSDDATGISSERGVGDGSDARGSPDGNAVDAADISQPDAPDSGTDGDVVIEVGPPAPGNLLVAPDEHHVAFLSHAQRSLENQETITGTLGIGTVDANGSIQVRAVAAQVEFSTVAFSSDGQTIVFTDHDVPYAARGNANLVIGNLEVASAEGTAIKTVATGVIDYSLVGGTLFYQTSTPSGDSRRFFAEPLSLGTTVVLPGGFGSPNATGSATVYRMAGGYGLYAEPLPLVELPSGTTHTLNPGTDLVGPIVWSNLGTHLAFLHQPMAGSEIALAMVLRDGSMRTELSADCLCENVVFAPDDTRVAYDVSDGQGGAQVIVHSLVAAADATLTGLPAGRSADNQQNVSFSQDGQYVFVTSTPPNSSNTTALYVAPADRNGPFRLLAAGIEVDSIDAADGFAALGTPRSVEVISLLGGTPTVIASARQASYEAASGGAHLLVYPGLSDTGTVLPPGIGLASADGSGFNLLPASVRFASVAWLGHVALATIVGSSGSADLFAVSDTGLTVTPLASGADSYAWAPIASPRALFYGRSAPVDAGAAGLFVVALP